MHLKLHLNYWFCYHWITWLCATFKVLSLFHSSHSQLFSTLPSMHFICINILQRVVLVLVWRKPWWSLQMLRLLTAATVTAWLCACSESTRLRWLKVVPKLHCELLCCHGNTCVTSDSSSAGSNPVWLSNGCSATVAINPPHQRSKQPEDQ